MSNPKPIILLTGKPKIGKTSIIINLVKRFGNLAGGFYTSEIQSKDARIGFQIFTLYGETSQLAATNRDEGLGRIVQLGKYWVSLDAIETFAIPAIMKAIGKKQIVIVDEIGPMELLSPLFTEAISKLLESDCSVLGTIVERNHPFTDTVKAHERVKICEVTIKNRDKLSEEIYRSFIKDNL